MCISTLPRQRPIAVAPVSTDSDVIVRIPNADTNKRSIITQHHYHDHANDAVVSSIQEGSETPSHPQSPSLMRFPIKLHYTLSQIEQDGLGHIMSWQPHGRCFVIHKPDEFKTCILSQYFDTSKMSSFQRQLSLYGFTRLTKGKDRGGYYHELFLRGKLSLAHNIQRTKVKGTGVRAKSNPDQEPNLWAMSWVGTSGEQEEAAVSTITSSQQVVRDSCLSSSIATEAEHGGDLMSFAGRHFHFVDINEPASELNFPCAVLPKCEKMDTFLSELQSWEVDIDAALEGSDGDDALIRMLDTLLAEE